MVEQVKTKSEPRVRFRGFTDEWEQVKLGDLITPFSEKTTENDQYPVLTSSRRGLFLQQDYYNGNQIASKDNVGYNIVPRGYFTYRHMSDDEVFKFNINNLVDYGMVSTLYPVFTTKETMNSEYLQYQLNNGHEFQRYAIIQKQGGSRTYMYLSRLEKLSLTIPSLDEQQKIGELFQTLDKAIDLSNTQVENLKQQKKALLQHLFPQKGETEPKVRLRGFTDDWEEVTLGDVFSVYSKKGRTDLPFVTVGERETNERTASAQGYGNDVSDNARAKAKVLLSGQFLIDLSSYGRGIYMSRMDGVTSSAYNVLNLDNGADSYWVEYLISHDFVESLKRLTPPGARQGKMIEVDGLLKTKTFVPSLEEQQAIGELFQTLDEQIRLAEDKVSQYKELKQALLQRLFV